MKRFLLISLLLLFVVSVQAQTKAQKKQLNWYNKDLKKDKVYGVSTEKAYQELLAGKTPQTVVVAVIDGGTDINHEDLKQNVWTNTDEIPGNGIDDDHNGYVDDIHGWNFIGNAKGEDVHHDNLEVTRLYRELSAKFKDANASVKDNDPQYRLYLKVKERYLKESAAAEEEKNMIDIGRRAAKADSTVRAYLKKETYTSKDLKFPGSAPEEVRESASELRLWMMFGLTIPELLEYCNQCESQIKYHYNLDYDPRSIVGDDYKDNSNRSYGNNDVIGPDAGHGTFVAGEIAAVRNNKIGVDGVAANAQIMVVRIVPDGDERDKDVANGIRYAIENGAKVINMSFGKPFSPQKEFVDEVLPLAEKYDVLLICAAGNDAQDLDTDPDYPNPYASDGHLLTNNWLCIGASSMNPGRGLPAEFSNYGQTHVDVFAPGLDLWGLVPGNQYGSSSGTSMAAPVTTGVAAVIRSYYPQLSAVQVKEIIMKSVIKYDGKVKKPAESGDESVDFSSLSKTGGVVNLYEALKLAAQMADEKK
jgi:subtilisin family serine protease